MDYDVKKKSASAVMLCFDEGMGWEGSGVVKNIT